MPRRHAKGTGRVEPDEKSLAELLKDLSEQTANLVHQDVELAKAEMSVKGKLLATGPGLFAGAGVAGFLALAALVAGAIAGLAEALPVWLAALIVAVGFGCPGRNPGSRRQGRSAAGICPCPKRRWRARRRMWNG